MPLWGEHLSAEELAALEAQLRASLVPVEADRSFVEEMRARLQTPRPLYVPQARTWQQAWLIFGGLSGTLLALAGLTVFLFFHHRSKRSAT